MTITRTYPIERKLVILRPISQHCFEEREEVWLQLSEMDSKGNTEKSLVSSKPTGRIFKRTRKVASESNPIPTEKEVFSYLDPEDWCLEFYEQLAGPALDRSTLPIGRAKQPIGDIA